MPEGEEKEQEIENLFENTMKENFPNLVKEIDIQVRKAHRVPNKMDTKRTTPRHIIIKMPKVKDKERILKAAKEKQIVTYKGVPIRVSADYSKETASREKGTLVHWWWEYRLVRPLWKTVWNFLIIEN